MDEPRWELVGVTPRGQRVTMVVRGERILSLTPPEYRVPMPLLLLGFVPSGSDGYKDDEPITAHVTIQDVTYEAATLGGRSVKGLRPYVHMNHCDMILGLDIESWRPLTS